MSEESEELSQESENIELLCQESETFIEELCQGVWEYYMSEESEELSQESENIEPQCQESETFIGLHQESMAIDLLH